MEVHPPHEPVHSWREALIHIGLMTVGLFIALMLEGLVEYLHHKELVHEARENIRRELEDNHKAAQANIASLSQNADKVKAGLTTLRFMQSHPDAHNQTIGYNMEFSGLSDAAWRTARDTGALGYMPYDEVQRYAGLYGFQDLISNQAGIIVTREAETLAPIIASGEHFEKIPKEQYSDMLRSTASNYMDVTILQQLVRGLDAQYVDALKH